MEGFEGLDGGLGFNPLIKGDVVDEVDAGLVEQWEGGVEGHGGFLEVAHLAAVMEWSLVRRATIFWRASGESVVRAS